MPQLHVRKPSEAPLPSRSSKAVREQQQKYDEFVRRVEVTDVGDLELGAAEPRVRERAEALAAESGKGYAYAEAFKAFRFVDDEEQEPAASRA